MKSLHQFCTSLGLFKMKIGAIMPAFVAVAFCNLLIIKRFINPGSSIRLTVPQNVEVNFRMAFLAKLRIIIFRFYFSISVKRILDPVS